MQMPFFLHFRRVALVQNDVNILLVIAYYTSICTVFVSEKKNKKILLICFLAFNLWPFQK